MIAVGLLRDAEAPEAVGFDVLPVDTEDLVRFLRERGAGDNGHHRRDPPHPAPGGEVMIQLWPFFHSEHGGHLWDRESFHHLLVRDLRDDIELNGIHLDSLQSALLSGGLAPTKV